MNVQGYTSHEEETDVTKLVIIFPTGRVQSITDSHPHFETLRTRIQAQDLDAEEAEALINERVHALNAQVNRLNTRMAVENGNLMVDGAPAHSALANHILRKIENGDDDYMRVVMFYENALDMPDGERDNLFAWLSDNGGFSLTEDGHVERFCETEKEWLSSSPRIRVASTSMVFLTQGNIHVRRSVALSLQKTRNMPWRSCLSKPHIGILIVQESWKYLSTRLTLGLGVVCMCAGSGHWGGLLSSLSALAHLMQLPFRRRLTSCQMTATCGDTGSFEDRRGVLRLLAYLLLTLHPSPLVLLAVSDFV